MTSIYDLEAEPFELAPPTEPMAQDELDAQELEAGPARTRQPGRVRQLRHPNLGRYWSVPQAQLPPRLRGLAAQRLAREVEEEIVPPDERVVVKDTTEVPYRWICRLDVGFGPDPSSPGSVRLAQGTGTLIGPRHVLTAAHNVRDTFGGVATDATGVRVVPAYNCLTKTGEPLGAAHAVRIRVHDRWRDFRDRQFDYALITLGTAIGDSRPKALGGQPLGYWGSPADGAGTRMNATDPARLRGLHAHLSGYPGDFCCMRPLASMPGCPWDAQGTAQMRAFGRITDPAPAVAPRLLFYDMDSVHGHSGSPVWIVYKEFRNLVAIHTGAARTFDPALAGVANRGVRITAEVETQIRRWMDD